MSAAVFIRCRLCNELYRVGASTSSKSASRRSVEDMRRIEFIKRHDGHPLETLAQVSEPELLTSQPQRSAARVLWEATNGQERLLVEGRARGSQSRSLAYRIVTSESIPS